MHLVGLLTAAAYWPHLLSSATAPRWAILALGAPLSAAFEPWRFDRTIATLLFAGIVYAGLSITWTPDPLTGVHEFFHLLILCGIAVAAAGISDIGRVLLWFSWGVGISALLTVPQMFGFTDIPQFSVPAGLFFNRTYLAELAAPLLVWTVLERRFYLGAILALPLLFCQSRIAIAVAVFGVLLARPRLTAAVGIAGIFYVGLAWSLGVLPVRPDKLASAIERLDIWQDALHGLTTISGHGIGAFATDYPHWDQAHSDLLQALYEVGYGILPFAIFFAIALRAANGAERGAFGAVLFQAAVSFPLHFPATGFLAWALAGHLASRRSLVLGVQPLCGSEIRPAV